MNPREFVDWATSELPLWQQDALRRLAVSFDLKPADLQSLLALAKTEHGIGSTNDLTAVPISEKDLPSTAAVRPRAILRSLGNLSNVNRIAADQTLPFATSGITLVYGDNGSGKSGYSRILKAIVGHRASEEILGNVLLKDVPTDRGAQITFHLEGDESENVVNHNWQLGQETLDELRGIAVFDSKLGSLYLNEKNQFEYIPIQLELLGDLGKVCARLAETLTVEVQSLQRRLQAALPIVPKETTTSAIIGSLVETTPIENLPSVAELKRIADLSEDESKELSVLEEGLKNDQKSLSDRSSRCGQACEMIASEIEKLAGQLNDGNIKQALIHKFRSVLHRRLANLVVSDLANSLGIHPDHLTSQNWRNLFRAALQYSESIYPGVAPPASREGDVCVLCRQPLDPVARERLRRMADFVSGGASKAAEDMEQKLANLVSAWKGLRIRPATEIQQVLAEFGRLGPERQQVVDAALRFLTTATSRLSAILSLMQGGAMEEVPVIDDECVSRLRKEKARLDAEAEEYSQIAQGDTLKEQRQRRDELGARKSVGDNLQIFCQRRTDVELLAKTRNTLEQVRNTRQLSDKVREIRRVLITSGLQKAVNDELEALGLGNSLLRIHDFTDRAESAYDLQLDAPHEVSVSQVLSEGEQRAAALACFFAELSLLPSKQCIILDDPASSLDHLRIERIANRIVKEARSGRQVVVFTHNLLLYHSLLDSARQLPQVPVGNIVVHGTDETGPGLIFPENEPWIAKEVTKRIELIRLRLPKLEKIKDTASEAYRDGVKAFYTDLRETWERLIEEILFNKAVTRFDRAVKMERLSGALVEDSDFLTVYNGWGRASEFSGHDKSIAKGTPLPETEAMRKDLKTLDEYRDQIQKRKSKLEKQRDKLKKPPKAELG